MSLFDNIEDDIKHNNCKNKSNNDLTDTKVEIIDFKEKEISDCKGLASPLASEESTRKSLLSIREKKDGLNQHRQSLLARVPEQKSFASYKVNLIEDRDLAYLSAYTGDEFALLRGKKQDVLYHGTRYNCDIDKEELLMALLESHQLRLEIHSHPDYDKIVPSVEDRNFLNRIGQKESKIISSYTGKIITFNVDRFGNM